MQGAHEFVPGKRVSWKNPRLSLSPLHCLCVMELWDVRLAEFNQRVAEEGWRPVCVCARAPFRQAAHYMLSARLRPHSVFYYRRRTSLLTAHLVPVESSFSDTYNPRELGLKTGRSGTYVTYLCTYLGTYVAKL